MVCLRITSAPQTDHNYLVWTIVLLKDHGAVVDLPHNLLVLIVFLRIEHALALRNDVPDNVVR
jgi:hypothetical protein